MATEFKLSYTGSQINEKLGKVDGAVRFDTAQNLTDEQKAQARKNIGAAAEDEGGGGTSVQTDWNQTDETAADFIKNKPFGSSTGEAVLLETASLEFYESWNGWYEAYPEFDCGQIKAGNTVKVHFDGEVYELIAESVSNLSGEAILVGNTRVWDDNDNGIPFSILIASSLMGLSCTVTVFEGSEHTVGISKAAETVKKLENKYINTITLYYGYQEEYQFSLHETEDDSYSLANPITRTRLQEIVEEYSFIRVRTYGDGGYGFSNVAYINNLYKGSGLGGDAYAVVYAPNDGLREHFYTAEYWGY